MENISRRMWSPLGSRCITTKLSWLCQGKNKLFKKNDLKKIFNFILYFIEAKNLKSSVRFVNLKIFFCNKKLINERIEINIDIFRFINF